jgi:hypothetical protein
MVRLRALFDLLGSFKVLRGSAVVAEPPVADTSGDLV